MAGHIGDALTEQERVIGLLAAEIGELAERLTLALRPPVPAPQTAAHGAGAPSPALSSVADALMERTYRIDQLVTRVRDLAARVDL